MAKACGVDFGTSNSTVGWRGLEGAGSLLLPLEEGKQTLPSVVFFNADDNEFTYGRAALTAYLAGYEGRLMRSLKSLLGSGAIVVCDDTTCMLDMALNAVRFYRNESCGKCVPCRLGSQKMTDLLIRWTEGAVREPQYRADLALLDDLSETMSQTSICGLGQIAPAPIRSVLKHFRAEVDAHVLKGQCPSGVCFTTRSRAGEAERVGIRP